MYKVLVVDDDIDVAETIQAEVEILLEDKVEVDMAYDGAESLSMSEKKHYHLIITDYKMPVMNGVEFVTRMKKNKNSPNFQTPVIFISGFIPDVKEILDLTDKTIFIDKPYEPQSFRRNIKIMLASEEN